MNAPLPPVQHEAARLQHKRGEHGSLRALVAVVIFTAGWLTTTSVASANCGDISASHNITFHNGWRDISEEAVPQLASVTSWSGFSGAQCDVQTRNSPNLLGYRRCNAGTVTLTGPAASCPSEPEPDDNISQVPLFITQAVTPQVMLTMSNDHQLYFEAYPDYADLTGDGIAERQYNHAVDYYGYFDAYKCYTYANNLFTPVSVSGNKYCSGSQWSGNFLNYLSMSRIDVIRKILYGGYRSTDTASSTILERSYLPNDAHSWVRYYDGEDIDQLTPFSLPPATTASSNDSRTVPFGSRDETGDRLYFVTGWSSSQVQLGDQVRIRSNIDPNTVWMKGVVREYRASDGRIHVQVTSSSGVGQTRNAWQITNDSRRGISFCNTTVSNTTWSQNVTDPPLIRVASGNYSLWTANERWQCRWSDERNRTGHNVMRIGGLNFSNGNDLSATGLSANADNPVRSVVGLGAQNYVVRVQACVSGLVNRERCTFYPSGNLKPTGLLQQYGDDGRIHFGLMTGSYVRNKSGGVLRKNIAALSDEIAVETDGTFLSTPAGGGIIGALNRFRIFGYSHSDGTYNSGDSCSWGLSSFNDGNCTNWGNPLSELYLETLRYFAGKQPSAAFVVSGTDRISGLPALTAWNDPLDNNNWCAPLNVIAFNSSVSSYDGDQLGGTADLGAGSAASLTHTVGAGEGIHGKSWLVGESGSQNNQQCTAKSVSDLGSVLGICPEAPRLQGSYHIAGLAHYAYTESLRSDLIDVLGNVVDIQAKTFGVTLAPAVPSIRIPIPGGQTEAVTLLPACHNSTAGGNCAIVDFRIVEMDTAAGTGRFLVNWENSEQGGDYDMDMNGVIAYQIAGNQLTVTTNVFSQSADSQTGFGYVISGTSEDGFYVHSGINGYTRTGNPGCNNCQMSDPPTSRTFTIDATTEAVLLREPLYYAAKWGGFHKPKRPSDPQFPADPASWDRNGDGQPDNYYYAIDPGRLAADLEAVFQSVFTTLGSASAVAANSTQLTTDTRVFQARFDSQDWRGELIAYSFDPNSTGLVELWNAAEEMPDHGDRNLFTIHPDGQTGVNFEWNALHSTQQSKLGNENVLSYLRGNPADEQQNGGNLRSRPWALGDIVHSAPVFVPPSLSYHYPDSGYAAFVSNNNAPNVIYVGSNSGMLHAFDADSGEELFGFVPNAVFDHLAELTDPDYSHRYFVDGEIFVGHANIPARGGWRTVLVGGLGAGGKSLFALDVTNPDNFTAADVLWEFTHADLGYTFGRPTVAPMGNDNWAVIFGNGYYSTGAKAALFVVNVASGALIKQITVDAGPANGLSAPVTVANKERRIVHAFAGDLKGNLWKFDFCNNCEGQNPNYGVNHWDASWTQGQNKLPLFTTPGNRPITVRPAVGKHPDGGHIVFFGTGKFFDVGDNIVASNPPVEAFYGLRDGSRITGLNELLEHKIMWEGLHTSTSRELRVTTSSEESPYQVTANTNDKGWYIRLMVDGGSAEGERVIHPPILRHGRVIFTTLIPNTDPCAPGAGGWLMELRARDGSRLPFPVFDLNDDSKFDDDDLVIVVIDGVEVKVPPSGIGSEVGSPAPPAIIDEGTIEHKLISGSSGEVQHVRERSGGGNDARTSWRQLR